MNAFRHGLSAVDKKRQKRSLTGREKRIKAQVREGQIADKGEDISTAQKVLAEIISDDVAWLVTFNRAIDNVIQNNPRARENRRRLADGN